MIVLDTQGFPFFRRMRTSISQDRVALVIAYVDPGVASLAIFRIIVVSLCVLCTLAFKHCRITWQSIALLLQYALTIARLILIPFGATFATLLQCSGRAFTCLVFTPLLDLIRGIVKLMLRIKLFLTNANACFANVTISTNAPRVPVELVKGFVSAAFAATPEECYNSHVGILSIATGHAYGCYNSAWAF